MAINAETAPRATAVQPGPGDASEREADRVAQHLTAGTQAMPRPRPLAAAHLAPAPVPTIVDEALSSRSQPLDLPTRRGMERRLGHDFGHVRVHADPLAARSADALQAQAYTLGSDVVFGPGRYAPHSQEGQWLLAHELTHVVQQDASSAKAIQRQPAPSSKPEAKQRRSSRNGSRSSPTRFTAGSRPAELGMAFPGLMLPLNTRRRCV